MPSLQQTIDGKLGTAICLVAEGNLVESPVWRCRLFSFIAGITDRYAHVQSVYAADICVSGPALFCGNCSGGKFSNEAVLQESGLITSDSWISRNIVQSFVLSYPCCCRELRLKVPSILVYMYVPLRKSSDPSNTGKKLPCISLIHFRVQEIYFHIV